VAGATELEEARDHNEEARVLKKPVEMSKSDSKERNQNKEKPGQKFRRKNTPENRSGTQIP
jgi:hypothetical protein